MTYSDKLKDPRWQKKRLEIFNRDNWRCVYCDDDKSTLVVHHLEYSGEPWEVDNIFLITLCSNCHELEHTYREEEEKKLLNLLKAVSYRDLRMLRNSLKTVSIPSEGESVLDFDNDAHCRWLGLESSDDGKIPNDDNDAVLFFDNRYSGYPKLFKICHLIRTNEFFSLVFNFEKIVDFDSFDSDKSYYKNTMERLNKRMKEGHK